MARSADAVGSAVTLVVMGGGRGERLWPLVRARSPKVCLSPDGIRSLLQATIDRLRQVWPRAGWLIVTTQEQAAAVRRSLPAPLRRAVLVEPQGKGTAACITLAAAALAMRDPARVMVVVPADHWVGEVPAFRAAVRAAIRAAVAHDTLATIGIRPTHPHPGLGYLCAGAQVEGSGTPRIFRLARFVEKPSPAAARRLVRRPRTYWNCGIFVGTAGKFLECVAEWLPDHARRLVPLAGWLSRAQGAQAGLPPLRVTGQAGAFAKRARAAYGAVKAVSFDHGVMDHLRRGLLVEGRFAWADLGSWDAWARVGKTAVRTVTLDSRDVTVIGQPGHLVAAIGVRGLLVVQTPSATLICRPDKAQAVRDVVQRLSTDPRLAAYR